MNASTRQLFPGFEDRIIDVGNGIHIAAVIGGAGPPLLLLHGHPQTHAIWHRVAPTLAGRFTVVAADLRGYGDSSKPIGASDHSNYAKRVMAKDQLALMRRLGFERFDVLAHDRGARVAHRLAMDHPEVVRRLVLLDVAPTLAMYEQTSQAFARAYWHWFFLIQPAPLPERLIEADPAAYIRDVLSRRSAGLAPFDPLALAEYQRCGARKALSTSVLARSMNGGALRAPSAAARCPAATTSPRKRRKPCLNRCCLSSLGIRREAWDIGQPGAFQQPPSHHFFPRQQLSG